MIGNIEQMTSREQTSPELLAACHLSVDDVCMLSNVWISCSLSLSLEKVEFASGSNDNADVFSRNPATIQLQRYSLLHVKTDTFLCLHLLHFFY